MKRRRHDLIKQIIREEIIETQEALAAALCARHVHVTQATISRDIKELLLIRPKEAAADIVARIQKLMH